MTHPPPFPLGPRGPFVLLGVLGQGAMGAVYRAHDQRTQREVAVKFVLGVDKERQARFAREGELTASLRHPGILQVHDAGVLEGVPYLVYELVPDARTFEAFLLSAERREALLALRDAAAALGHAHAQGVIHRDVKPDNLLVSGEGRLVVADFGLAAARDAERLTRTGALLGTPLFMAPEQLTGAHAASPATDVWALGVILFRILADELPFNASTLPQLAAQVCVAKVPRLASLGARVPLKLEGICVRALRRDPLGRYPSGAELAADLTAYLEGRSLSSQTASALREVRWRTARGPILALSLLCLLALGLLGFVVARRHSPPAASPTDSAQGASSPVDSSARPPVPGSEEWLAAGAAAWQEVAATQTLAAERRALAAWLLAYPKHPREVAAQARERQLRGEVPLFRLVHRQDEKGDGPETDLLFVEGGLITFARKGGAKRWRSRGKGRFDRPRDVFKERADVRAMARQGDLVLAAVGRGQLRILGKKRGVPLRKQAHVECLSISPDGEWVAVGYTKGGWDLRRLANNRVRMRRRGRNSELHRIEFSPDGTRVLVTMGDAPGAIMGVRQAIEVWRVFPKPGTTWGAGGRPRDPVASLRLPGVARALLWKEDPRILLGINTGHLVAVDASLKELYSYDAPRAADSVEPAKAHVGSIRGVVLTPDGRHVISVAKLETTMTGELRVWARSDRSLVRTSSLEDPPCSLRLSPDGEVLGVGTFQGVVELWAAPYGPL